VCGGEPTNEAKSCIVWTHGSTNWTHLHTTSAARDSHVAWVPPSLPNSIVLLGGWGASHLTAEIVPGGGTFALRHSGLHACGIPDEDTIVMTGGGNHYYVTRYNVNGFVEELPHLPENRYLHVCAALPSTKAFIVAGGWAGSDGSSVLTLLRGAQDWTPLASLPRTITGASASILGGKIRVTGGWDGSSDRSEVLEYQPVPSNEWTTVGQLETKRRSHAVLPIGSEALPCLQGASETTTTRNTKKATTTATTTTSPDQNESTEHGSTEGEQKTHKYACFARSALCTGNYDLYEGVLEVALPLGILLLVIIVVAIGCVIRKRPEKKQEVMNADENPVYGVC